MRLVVDGTEYPEIKLAKPAFSELCQLHRDPRELFHMLADFAVMAANAPQIAAVQPSITEMTQRLNGVA